MNPIATPLLVLGLLAAAPAHEPAAGPATGLVARAGPSARDDKKDESPARKMRGKFTVGKETTYVTAPLDPDGYPDYAAALNERLSQGVTAENNANVLLWKALGPHPERAKMSPKFFRLLGIPAPPEEGDYFLALIPYLNERDQFNRNAQQTEELFNQLDRATQRPWTTKQYPNLAWWLKANEKPLAVVNEASKRTHYFLPLLPQGSAGLISALIPSAQKCRELANALAARAMLRTGEGDLDGAWNDLLACHRLGRLVGRGGTLIEGLVGVAIDGLADRADLALLDGAKPDAKRIESCLRDLQQLPPLSPMADQVDLLERFTFLESVMLIDRHGSKYLEGLADGASKAPKPLGDRVPPDIDWDPALRNANRWYDRLAAALREKDHAVREKKLNQIETELKALKAKLTGSDAGDLSDLEKNLGKRLQSESGAERGKVLGDVLATLLIPAVHKVAGAEDRGHQSQENVRVAFALAWYQRDHRDYPKDLQALVPQYLKQAPHDLFAGKPLVYRPTAIGYLLYSVGPNGEDDEGRGPQDQPPGDDLSVRMPLPELPRK